MQRIIVTIVLISSCLSSAYAEAQSSPVPYIAPFNTIVRADWNDSGRSPVEHQSNAAFKAIIFRQSKRICYEIDLRDIQNTSTVEIGRGIPGHRESPTLQLSAIAGSKSGTCTKLPKKLANELLDRPLLMYLQVTSSSLRPGNAIAQIKRTTQNTAMNDLKNAFRSEPKEQDILAIRYTRP